MSARPTAEGFDVFLSYNRHDSAPVEWLAHRLRHAGLEPFLDRWAQTAGRLWQEELVEALRASRACAVFVGPAGLGNWVREELAIACSRAAHDRAFRLFMVLLEGAPPADDAALAMLYTRTWVDLRAGIEDPDAVEELVAAVRGEPRRRDNGIAPLTGRCPYRGLAAFGELDADDFFGREDDTRRIVERLRGGRFVAALGPSGSGKSSLVRAGLVPALRGGALPGSEAWTVETLTPGGRPLDTLAARLARLFPDRPMQRTLDALAEDERTLDLAVALGLDGAAPHARLLLVIDQLEEVFTLCSHESQRAAFLANLVYAATIPGGRGVVTCAMRADFYPRCAAYPGLRAVVAARQFLVGPLDEDGLRRAIEEPARRAGLQVQPALVDELIGDLRGRPGALPLLQHALLELWHRRRDGMLTLTSYAESGGVKGALANRAETTYEAFAPARQATAERALLTLVQPGEGTQDTRRRVEIGQLPEAGDAPEDVEAVVRALADGRLLTTSRDEATGARMVEITHEALLRAWPRLRGWIERDREALIARRRLSEAAKDWDQHGRDPEYLYTGARLDGWQERDEVALGSRERAFLAASRRWAAQRRAAARRRVRLAFAALGAILALISGAGLIALRASRQAGEERDAARSRELAATAAVEVGAHPGRALGLALAAYQLAPTTEAETLLRQATLEFRAVGGRHAHRGATSAVAVSPDGRRIASGGEDGGVALWDPGGGTRVLQRPGRGEIPTVAFSARGDRVAAAGDDRVVRVWTVAGGGDSVVLGRAPGPVRALAFDPGGGRLASVDRSGAVRLWSLRPGVPPRALRGSRRTLQAVAFTPDGEQLIAVGEDGMVRIWDVEAETPATVLSGGPEPLLALAVSPDGRTIAAAGLQGRVWRWDVDPTRQREPRPLRALDAKTEVNGLTFTRNGQRLAAGGQDGAVRIWDRSGHPVGALKAFGRATEAVAAGPGPDELVSGDQDGIVWLWRPSDVTVLEGVGSTIDAVDLAPDGRRLAGVDAGGRVLLWPVAPGRARRPQVIAAASARLWSVAFDRRGDQVLGAGEGGTLVRYERGTHAAQRLPPPSRATIWRAVFAPGGRVVAASDDGAVRLLPADGSAADEIIRHRESATSVDVSSDGRRLLSAGTDRTVRLARTDAPHQPRILLRQLASSAEFAPDGRTIVTASEDGAVRLWSATGAAERTLRGHEGTVWHAAFSADGRHMVSGGDDATVRVWSVDSGSMVILRGSPGPVFRVDVDRRAGRIASTSDDKTVRLWTCDACGPMGEVVAVAERRWIP